MFYSSPWSSLQLVVAYGKKVIRRVSLSVRLLMPSAIIIYLFYLLKSGYTELFLVNIFVMTTYIVGLGRAKCSEIASVRVRNVGIRVRFQMNERSTVRILSFSLRPNKPPTPNIFSAASSVWELQR